MPSILNSRLRWLSVMLALVAIVALTVACGDDDDDDAATNTPGGATNTPAAGESPTQGTSGEIPVDVGKDDEADLTGAGATFPQLIYQAWFDDYKTFTDGGVSVNYQGVGSGGGIQQFTEGTVDFGASDAPMSADDIAAAPDVQHLPTVIGAVVLTYNVDGVDKLTLDGETIAGIFLGNIKKWNDPAIADLNAGVDLPDKDIQVVHRSDSSGTTFIFTDYLANASADWKAELGDANKAPDWPVGQGGQGNPGVTNAVKQTPNSIGYVELSYAIENNLPYADVINKAGKAVTPSLDSASAAAAGATIPDDYRVSIVNADGDDSYPIVSMTWLLLYKSTGKCEQQTPLVDMLWWAYHDSDAQARVKELEYAPLPESLLPRIEETLKSLKCDDGAAYSLKGVE